MAAFVFGLLIHILPAADEPQGKPPALPPVGVSVPRGFCDRPVTIKLAPPVDGAAVRWTVDGSEPSLVNGQGYTTPVLITNTTVLRAAAFRGRTRVSAITTHSYLSLDEILRQPKDPPGLPTGPRAWNGYPSAYAMDPRVVDAPRDRERMKAALQSLPSLSIVCRREDLFGARTGIYFHSLERGESWEKPCSAELILPDGSTGFQIDCGLRIQGNYNRIPVKSPKHAFRLLFKEQYGPGRLHYPVFPDSPVTTFNTLVLRADYNNSWIHWDPAARPRAQRTRDAWMKDSHRAMGWVAPHNRYLHLYLNGLYWGIYDATERPDASFAASYFGGGREEYDVINEFEAKAGTIDGFRTLQSMTGLSRAAQYEKLQQRLNLAEYMDYLLLQYYGGNQDIGENKNWYAIRRRVPPGPFHYVVWDAEQVLQSVQDDTVNDPYEVPFRLAQELMANAEFRLAFADRVQKHCFHDGALTPAATAARWKKRASEVDLAMIAESARWGYYRRNPPYTREKEWLTEQRRLLQSYFPQRTGIVLAQLRAAGLYPRIAAPAFNQAGGAIADEFRLSIASTDGARVYFTTNGVEPRVSGTGAVSPQAHAYAEPVLLQPPCQVKARALKEGTWSALSEAAFARRDGD